ncbi:hypothetical protein PR202_ga13870 [Eleusine coracana subsp. coracana]|uniref:Complex III subunit VII n=1 Tax=Eleusine coracana subsp. coracana TaxID=191504 RepID=A0AAV5CF64_ELECO|nr:hypothetical protein PR202_ga13870 [Eleusine coracana subsp. coracana]
MKFPLCARRPEITATHSPTISSPTKARRRGRSPHPAAAVGRGGSPAPPATMSSMMSALSQWFVNPRRNPLARLHMHAISSRLRKYGLRYDDLYDPYFDLDIKEALGRLPTEVVDARIQRLKRAMDLSMKHQYLPEDVQVRSLLFPLPSACPDLDLFVRSFLCFVLY